MSRAERRRAKKGIATCVICGKLRKLSEMALCMACDPQRSRKGEKIDLRELLFS